jgi:hypothetical protein
VAQKEMASANLEAQQATDQLNAANEQNRIKSIMAKRQEEIARRGRTPGKPIFSTLLNNQRSLLG